MSDAVERAAEVMIAHTRTKIEGCHCGWSRLGASHAEHVAQALADAGLLVDGFKVERATSWETGEVDYHRLVGPWVLDEGDQIAGGE